MSVGELRSGQAPRLYQLQTRPKWDMECRRVVHMAVEVLHSA